GRFQNYNYQSHRCGYPGFEVHCDDNKQALLKLSNDRNFVVKSISFERQRIWVNGPNDCPPQRFIENININDDLPFVWDNTYGKYYENVTFLNCSTNSAKEPNPVIDELPTISCMSNANYSIMYTLQSSLVDSLNSSCHEIGFARVPVKDNSSEAIVVWDGLYSDALLRWVTPSCRCEPNQFCGFLSDTGLNVTCYTYDYGINFPGRRQNHIQQRQTITNVEPNNREPPWFVFGLDGSRIEQYPKIQLAESGQLPTSIDNGYERDLVISLCIFLQSYQQRQTITNIEPSNREPPWFVFGLDRSMIEEYPNIQLAESVQLPKSIDNVCFICLSEYKPMEKLRRIPQRNHHFYVDCIDVWLKMNATCPLCRNLPGL
ncbi:hypothetical protein RYX36_003130, partial [Vicia faba]